MFLAKLCKLTKIQGKKLCIYSFDRITRSDEIFDYKTNFTFNIFGDFMATYLDFSVGSNTF